MKKGVLIFWLVLLLVIVGGVGASFMAGNQPNKLDSFAQCIKSKGVVFYGAFWCPHCQKTKAMFGTATQYLPYVECSTSDGQHQTQVCKDAGIESYPTWTLPATTTRLTGEHTLEELSTFSGCPLP